MNQLLWVINDRESEFTPIGPFSDLKQLSSPNDAREGCIAGMGGGPLLGASVRNAASGVAA